MHQFQYIDIILVYCISYVLTIKIDIFSIKDDIIIIKKAN